MKDNVENLIYIKKISNSFQKVYSLRVHFSILHSPKYWFVIFYDFHVLGRLEFPKIIVLFFLLLSLLPWQGLRIESILWLFQAFCIQDWVISQTSASVQVNIRHLSAPFCLMFYCSEFMWEWTPYVPILGYQVSWSFSN